MLQSGHYFLILLKTQNLWLLNESGFKSRAAYDGARTVNISIIPWNFDDSTYDFWQNFCLLINSSSFNNLTSTLNESGLTLLPHLYRILIIVTNHDNVATKFHDGTICICKGHKHIKAVLSSLKTLRNISCLVLN